MNYAELFRTFKPGFFQEESIRRLPPEYIFEEQILDLHAFNPAAVVIPCPGHIAFGFYNGDINALRQAVARVDHTWLQYFNPGESIFCAFDGDKVASFCLLDNFGEYKGLKIGGPGCVGTVPEYRRQGIGLKMVQLATGILKEQGYDLSYIHYTHVGHWYARLGYETILTWNCTGILSEKK